MSASTPRPLATRLFEGWQLGALAVGLAMISAWLAVPRPVEPSLVPLPQIDRRELEYIEAGDAERVRKVRDSGLPYAVRAVGELVRRHGKLLTQGDFRAADARREELQQAATSARAEFGEGPLADLRALQASYFVSAVSEWQRTTRTSAELSELAPKFADKCARMGWTDPEGKLRLTEVELRTLFLVRWTELIGRTADSALRPRLDQFRLYYSLLLRFPGGEQAQDQDLARLRYAAAIAQLDGSYPEGVARGVLLYKLGQPHAAFDAFSSYLRQHPDGPWTQRARNHALAAYAQLDREEDELPLDAE